MKLKPSDPLFSSTDLALAMRRGKAHRDRKRDLYSVVLTILAVMGLALAALVR